LPSPLLADQQKDNLPGRLPALNMGKSLAGGEDASWPQWLVRLGSLPVSPCGPESSVVVVVVVVSDHRVRVLVRCSAMSLYVAALSRSEKQGTGVRPQMSESLKIQDSRF